MEFLPKWSLPVFVLLNVVSTVNNLPQLEIIRAYKNQMLFKNQFLQLGCVQMHNLQDEFDEIGEICVLPVNIILLSN